MAWCLSIVGQAAKATNVLFRSTFVFKNEIYGNEKELKKKHSSNSIVLLSISVAEMYFSNSWRCRGS